MEGEVQVSESTSTEQAQPAPSVETTQESTVSRETETEQTNGEAKPAGFDPVDFTPAQLERFNRVYGNMKRYESDARELKEHNQRLIDTVNQLAQGQQQIVSHLQVSDFQEAESRLSADRDAAWNKGDVKGFNEATDKLHEIKTKRLLASQQPQPRQQQPTQQQQSRTVDGERVVNVSLERGDIDSAEANIAKSWMSQSDVSGNLIRPWTQPNHPNNYAAAKEADAVFNSPLFADKSMADKLREVDRRMGVQAQQGGQNVLGAGNLTKTRQTNNIKLDPKIEDIAVKTKFAGRDPKLTAQDHINAWAKAVAKSQPKQGARR